MIEDIEMYVCFVLSFIVYFLSVQCLSFFYGFCQMYFVCVCRIPKVDEELRVSVIKKGYVMMIAVIDILNELIGSRR